MNTFSLPPVHTHRKEMDRFMFSVFQYERNVDGALERATIFGPAQVYLRARPSAPIKSTNLSLMRVSV